MPLIYKLLICALILADCLHLALTLEELDQVFSVSTWKHASYQIKNAVWHFRVWVLRQKLEPLPKFYEGAEKLMES